MVLLSEPFLLETLHIEDASGLNHLMISNGKRFQKYLPNTLAQNISEDASISYIQDKIKESENKTEFTFAIKDKDTKQITGLVILKNITNKQGEFAYCLGAKYSGNGWVTKSITAATNFAFNELQLNTLQIITHHTNTQSINVAKRCGFYWIKTLVGEFDSEDSPLDMELYQKNA